MSAGFIPTPASNCRISTEKITSNFLDGSPLNTSRRRRAAHRLDLAVETLVRNRVQLQRGFLAFLQIGAIQFADLRPDFHFRKIQNIRHRHARLQRVALADVRHLLCRN